MLNLDLSQYNPVQSDSKFASVPLPSAHLVVIQESEMKESVKDGYTRGTNLFLELTILASSCGNEFVDEKLGLYIPISGFEETALRAGMKRLSTLAYTLGLGAFLQNKEDLHGQNFIVVLEKDPKNNFPIFKRVLNAQGMEIADASGNFKPCELKEVALATELEKLLAVLQGGNVGNPQMQQTAQVQTPAFGGAVQQTATQAPAQQSFVPNTNFAASTPNQVAAPNFGNQAQEPAQTQANTGAYAIQDNVPQQPQGNFGGAVPNAPQWGQTVNQNNGQ